ncbi:MAG: acetate--CoA ligase family protein [Rhodospirillales bacterium]
MANQSNSRAKSEDLFDASQIAPFFESKTLAVIGASTDPIKQGGRPVRYSVMSDFKGRVYPINPRADEVQGVKAYPHLSAVPGRVDCAFIALPAPAVEAAVTDCAVKGVRAAVIISAGFAEVGPKGRRQQERLTAIAREAGMSLVGPNCMGLMDIKRNFFPTFAPIFGLNGEARPKLGNISLVSQSGAFGAHAYELVRARGAGFSKWVTTGNQCDVEISDFVAYLADDKSTDVIMVYFEGNRDADKLTASFRKARDNGKPVVLLKAGRSETGIKAAVSHTGSMAGSDAAFDGFCRQFDVHRADTVGELIDIAVACAAGKYPARPRVGLVSISGGAGALMADYCAEVGLSVPPLPKPAQAKLMKLFPFGSALNPIDPTALWGQDMSVLSASMETLLKEGKHDSVVLFGSTIGINPFNRVRFEEHIIPLRKKYPKPLMVLSLLGAPDLIQKWRNEGFLIYEDARRAIEVTAALAKFGPLVRGRRQYPARPRVPDNLRIKPRASFNEADAMKALEKAGIRFVRRRLASSRKAALDAADRLGYPVVAKVASAEILHKSEIGGVALGLENKRDVAGAYDGILRRAKRAAPKAALDGVLIAKQISGGVETILGVNNDPGLGPVVMFGMGGIFVEVYQDVAFRVAPFTKAEARAMIRDVKGYAILAGARGQAPSDMDALAEALHNLSLFAAANKDTIASIDINPFAVMAKGKGALGLDALIEPL